MKWNLIIFYENELSKPIPHEWLELDNDNYTYLPNIASFINDK